MSSFEETYVENHRHQQFLVFGFSALLLLLTAAPRQERALFITDGSGIKAFGANLPETNFGDIKRLTAIDFFEPGIPGAPRAFFARTPGRPSVPGLPDAPGAGGPVAPAGFLPADPGGPAEGATPDVTPTRGAAIDGSDFPFAPPSLTTPGSSPAIGITPAAATPGTPVVPVVPTGPIVAALPEPSTWLMLISGFMMIGVVLRKRSPQAQTTEATTACD